MLLRVPDLHRRHPVRQLWRPDILLIGNGLAFTVPVSRRTLVPHPAQVAEHGAHLPGITLYIPSCTQEALLAYNRVQCHIRGFHLPLSP